MCQHHKPDFRPSKRTFWLRFLWLALLLLVLGLSLGQVSLAQNNSIQMNPSPDSLELRPAAPSKPSEPQVAPPRQALNGNVQQQQTTLQGYSNYNAVPPFNLNANANGYNAAAQYNMPQYGVPQYRAPLRANTAMNVAQAASRPMLQGSATGYGALSQVQLQRLGNHDLILIIDHSGSMGTRDCPPGSGVVATAANTLASLFFGGIPGYISRWDWCREQTSRLAQLTSSVIPKGFTVIPFGGRFNVFNNVTLPQVSTVFNNESPGGLTKLAGPLRSPINDYFKRRDFSGDHVKPLAIAIITDGDPTDRNGVTQTLIDATRQMRNPGEIKVTFFMIGTDNRDGENFVSGLERGLMAKGARFPIVKSVPFSVLQRVGLTRALADSLQ